MIVCMYVRLHLLGNQSSYVLVIVGVGDLPDEKDQLLNCMILIGVHSTTHLMHPTKKSVHYDIVVLLDVILCSLSLPACTAYQMEG